VLGKEGLGLRRQTFDGMLPPVHLQQLHQLDEANALGLSGIGRCHQTSGTRSTVNGARCLRFGFRWPLP
jgi:hypothetical protein